MIVGLLAATLAVPQGAPAPRQATVQAEKLAQDAIALAPRDAATALQQARKALALTAEFVPTDYVAAGRKGEVVEDEFKAAREAYQRHRAAIYDAVGDALARQGQELSLIHI